MNIISNYTDDYKIHKIIAYMVISGKQSVKTTYVLCVKSNAHKNHHHHHHHLTSLPCQQKVQSNIQHHHNYRN